MNYIYFKFNLIKNGGKLNRNEAETLLLIHTLNQNGIYPTRRIMHMTGIIEKKNRLPIYIKRLKQLNYITYKQTKLRFTVASAGMTYINNLNKSLNDVIVKFKSDEFTYDKLI